MSTAAIRSSDLALLRQPDLLALIVALPVFLLAGFPMLGYAVGAGAWLTQRMVQLFAGRRAAEAIARGERNAAMGAMAVASLGRVWLVSLSVLLVGVLAEREAGLAAAVLSAVLFTVYFASQAISRLLAGPGEAAG